MNLSSMRSLDKEVISRVNCLTVRADFAEDGAALVLFL